MHMYEHKFIRSVNVLFFVKSRDGGSDDDNKHGADGIAETHDKVMMTMILPANLWLSGWRALRGYNVGTADDDLYLISQNCPFCQLSSSLWSANLVTSFRLFLKMLDWGKTSFIWLVPLSFKFLKKFDNLSL